MLVSTIETVYDYDDIASMDIESEGSSIYLTEAIKLKKYNQKSVLSKNGKIFARENERMHLRKIAGRTM